MECLDFIKALMDVSSGTFDNRPRDNIQMNHTCTSPRVSFIHEERYNSPIKDLFNGDVTLKSINKSPSHKGSLVQDGQGKHVNLCPCITLDPPYSLRAYLNHQHILRQDDIMNFIHDISPNITLSKDKSLDHENNSS